MLACLVPAICLPPLRAQQDNAQAEKLETVKTTITVTGEISSETPANISVVDKAQIGETAGAELDDRLRSVPGFSLFRRTSSLVAHPTTQGVSLRGLGSSGASRSLVLWDGIPANDPFGGWVYWSRFTPAELDRVEVVRGAATSVFGDRAMAGSIAIVTRPPEKRHADAGFESGNRTTEDAWLGLSNLWSHWALSGHARAFTTDGYYIVPDTVRGPVDQMAGVRFVTGDVHLDWLGGVNQIFLKSDLLVESRKNGTLLTSNATSLGEVAGHYQRDLGKDTISVVGFHTREGFHSTFSSVAANRRTETLTFVQTVPAEATGADAFWRHDRSHWNFLAGADVYRSSGVTTDAFPTFQRIGSGVILQHGIFAQTDFTAGPVKLFLGARHSFTGQGGTFFSPNAGLVAGRGRWRGRASLYRSFRAPTLNELYRNFQVGNTLTQANPLLVPETVFGAEAGLDYVGEASSVRVTFFRNSLDKLITNVTLSSSGNAILKQRQNAAGALSRGAEVSARRRWHNWRGEVGYLFADSNYLTGKRIPEVPRHQGSAMLSFDRGGTMVSAGVRAYGSQFDDDLNQFLLAGFTTVQFVASQRLGKGFSASASFDNLLDRQYYVAFTPTPNIGAPRLWRIGVRWQGRLF
jgi:outer membrane receptor protein involved in Fe transport